MVNPLPSFSGIVGGVLEKDSAPHLTARQEQTVKLLESHKAPFRWVSSSVAAAEVSAPTEEGQEGVAPEEAYLELADPDEGTTAVRQSEEEVVTEQPKKVKKKRLLKQSDVLPAKKLRESEGFLDSSSQTNIRIHTTVESTLGIPVDTNAAAITSTRADVTNFATDVNPDLAGPSQPEGSEGSDDSFYEPPTLDPSEAKRCGSRCSPAFFSALRTMDYDQLYTEFNVGAARQVCLGAEVRSRAEHELELKENLRAKYAAHGRLPEEKDLEILRLKSQLAEKEAEAAEVIRLRDQVSSLSREKYALTAEVSEFGVSSLHAGFQDFKEKWRFSRMSRPMSCHGRWHESYEAHVMGFLRTSMEGRGGGVGVGRYLGHAMGRAVDFGCRQLRGGYEHGTVREKIFFVVMLTTRRLPKQAINDAVKALEDVDFPLMNLLKSKKDAGMDEVLDCFLLDGPLAGLPEAAYLQSCIE
ncbi:hypothetical protein Tco_0547855 [Tanacetum coccineum]